MEIDTVALIANLGVLSVAGVLYAAYIKNLRSLVSLKEEQIQTAETRIAFWRERAAELERQTPEYVEQLLAKRIEIREGEIARLSKDDESNKSELEKRGNELLQLKRDLEAARDFGRGISVYDVKTDEYKHLSPGELKLVDLGEVWVDSASLIICDPWHILMSREREIEDFPAGKYFYRVVQTGETFFLDDHSEKIEIEPLSEAMPANQLVESGILEQLKLPDELPVDPDTYIKGEKVNWVGIGKTKMCTFYNGVSGAGLVIGTGADGAYRIQAECYKDKIRRIQFDLL